MADGTIVIDKPQKWTSMDVCAKIRGVLYERRAGHAGTLDPMATSVLPVLVGRVTWAVESAPEPGKEYVAGLKLGVVTDTQDTTGQVAEERPMEVDRAVLEGALAAFWGEITQIPPMYSALRRDGKKLYELAWAGKEMERAPWPVIVHALEVLDQTGSDRYTLRVRCSKETYVRTLCHDARAALGYGGCISTLRRTEAARFSLTEAVPLEALPDAPDPAALPWPVSAYFLRYPAATVKGMALRKVENGNPPPCSTAGGD